MNTTLTNQLVEVLNKHFDFSTDKISWDALRKDWNTAISKSFTVNETDRKLFAMVLEEMEDVVIHMPGKNANAIDWETWRNEDDFLRYLLAKESLRYSMTPAVFEKIRSDWLKSGFFARPYRADEAFIQKVRSFIEKNISNSQRK